MLVSKPGLNALRFQRLKLQYDETVSNFAFNFNLRRYTEDIRKQLPQESIMFDNVNLAFIKSMQEMKVRRCRLTLSNPR